MGNAVADKYGLQVGTPAVSSAGAITFGPEGILFVADNAAATIFAIHVGDDATSAEPVEVAALDTRVGSLLGVAREDVRIAGCLTVIDDAGKPVPGQSALEAGERSWTFTPAGTWNSSPYALRVAPELEDVAGNSVTRVFDRDLTNPSHRPRPAAPTQVSLAGPGVRFGP